MNDAKGAVAPPRTDAPPTATTDEATVPPSDDRRDARYAAAGLGILALAWILPLLVHLRTVAGRVNGQNDFLFHIQLVGEVSFLPPHTPVPHFLFHVLTKAIGAPIGSDLAAGVVVVAAAFVATALAAFSVCYRPPERDHAALPVKGAALVAAAFLVADSPAVLAHGTNVLGSGGAYLMLHQLWNPTAVLLTPFVVLGLPVMVRYLEDLAWRVPGSPRRVVVPALLTAGSLLAKPTLFLVALVPFLLVFALGRYRANQQPVGPRDEAGGSRRYDLLAWVGVAAVLAWQAWFLLVGGESTGRRQGLGLSPFEMLRAFGAFHLDFWLLMLVPILVVVAAPSAVRRDRTLLVTWGMFAIGLAIAATVIETGDRRTDANAGQALHAGAQALWFFSVRALAGVLHAGDRRVRVLLAAGAVALCVAAGIASEVQNLSHMLG